MPLFVLSRLEHACSHPDLALRRITVGPVPRRRADISPSSAEPHPLVGRQDYRFPTSSSGYGETMLRAEVLPEYSAPILLYVHGGGFNLGDRFESGTNLRWFTDRGWLALSIDYTLSSADRHLWNITTSQVACAMAWTAANAARLGGDPARISLLGSSAGGNLAINAAYLANAGRLESSCGGTVPRVSAVSALYPPVDLAAAWVSQVPVISDMARRFNTYYVGGSPQQFPDRYQFVASATHINAAAPPTLVIFGANDHLVPPDATDRFAQQARNAGIAMESIRFPYGDHAFNLNQDGIGNQFYLGMTDRFLSEHGQRPANPRPDRE